MSANHTGAYPERFDKDAAIAATQSAALRGAALAFGKPPVKAKPLVNTYSGNNGALVAATKVGGARRLDNKASTSSLKADRPQDGQWSRHDRSVSRKSGNYTGLQQHILASGNGLLRPNVEQRRSTSFLAANLAVSRSPSVSPDVTGQRHLQKHSTGGGWEATTMSRRSASPWKSSTSSRSSDRPLDLTSIPPTTSLINMFEQNTTPSQSRPALLAAQKSVGSSAQRVPLVSALLPTPSLHPPKVQATTRISPIQHPPTSRPTSAVQPSIRQHAHSETRRPIPIGSRPQDIPTKNGRMEKSDIDDISSDDSFVSASDRMPSSRTPVHQQRRSDHYSSQYSDAAVDSLANAIVASSLATSRAASPSKNLRALGPPPPPSRRDPRGHHHLLHHNDKSRSGSPVKPTGLRTTMRKPKSEEEPDEGAKRRMKKAHLMKKHPNKHHEGDRKRWRDEITERERKRYEAVWASNRGLHLPPELESFVCNLVVRDIWSRSNLKDDVLEEVYSLVDRQGRGSLTKEEFVVGLWLVDQRLKGRKLPIRVSDSVWHSVGVLREIKLKPNKKQDKKSEKRK
jgi:hypothetical protein